MKSLSFRSGRCEGALRYLFQRHAAGDATAALGNTSRAMPRPLHGLSGYMQGDLEGAGGFSDALFD